MAGKYNMLRVHLKLLTDASVVLTFNEIEKLMGGPLPPAARSHLEWWANEAIPTRGHPQCHAWRDTGYNAYPNLTAETVTFRRSPEGRRN